MNRSLSDYLEQSLFGTYALFVFGCTFSIALAQSALGISTLLFLGIIAITRYNPFVRSLNFFYLPVSLYLIWMLLAALIAPSPIDSLSNLREEWLFAAVPIGIFLFNNEKYRNRLILIFAAGVILVGIYACCQHFFGTNWFRETGPVPAPGFGFRATGGFGSRITFGNFIGMAAMFLVTLGVAGKQVFARPQLFLIFGSAGFALVATLFSYSRGPVAGLIVVGIAACLFLKKRRRLFGLGAVAVVVLLVALGMPYLVERFASNPDMEFGGEYEGGRVFIWKKSFEVACENPLFGVGQGNFREAYVAKLRPNIEDFRKHSHAHSDLLNIAASAGFPAAVFFAGIWFCLFYRFINAARFGRVGKEAMPFIAAALAGSAVFLVTSISEATFADEEVRQALMFVWAAGLWPWYKASEPTEGNNLTRSLENCL